MVAAAMVAMVHLYTAALSRIEESKQVHRPYFSALLVLLAWSTLTLALGVQGLGRVWPSLLVASPLVSGFMGPAIYLHTLQLLRPEKPLPSKLIFVGLVGTFYALAVLVIPGGSAYLEAYIFGGGAVGSHPVITPLFRLHTATLLCFCGASAWAVGRPSMIRPQLAGRTLGWLRVTIGVGLGMLLLSNILPLMGAPWLAKLNPLATLPLAFFGLGTLRVHSEEAHAARAREASAHALRMDSLGRMARGLAHEVNNALAAVLGHAQLARLRVPVGGPVAEHLHRIDGQTQHIGALMKNLLSLAGRRDTAQLRVGVAQALRELQATKMGRLQLQVAEEVPDVVAGTEGLGVVLGALVDNALEASRPGAPVIVRAKERILDAMPPGAVGANLVGCWVVEFTVEDKGCGMDPSVAERALEPFFSTKDQQGMGLMKVVGGVLPVGGGLAWESTPGVGTTWQVWLPALAPLAEPSPPDDEPEPLEDGEGWLIIVDDNEDFLSTLSGLLEAEGHWHEAFTDGASAWAFAGGEGRDQLRAAVVDVRMPGMDGVELAGHLLSLETISRVVLMSGDEPGPRVAALGRDPRIGFIRKPFPFADLRRELGLRDGQGKP